MGYNNYENMNLQNKTTIPIECVNNNDDSATSQTHSPVQHQFLQFVQVTCNVLQGHVSYPRAPGQVQATELTQVLSNQLHTIISDLRAAREAQGSQVGKAVHHVDHTMIGDLPAGVKPQGVGGVALKLN